MLNVPGLAVPLYSLCAHLKQHGDAGVFPSVCSLGGYVVGLPTFLQASLTGRHI
jgi:hypothetical protein